MDSSPLYSGGLKAGDGMGDFMRFTTDAPLADRHIGVAAAGAASGPVDEAMFRRRPVGMERRSVGRGLRRLA